MGGSEHQLLDDAPCLPGKAQGLGLYIETRFIRARMPASEGLAMRWHQMIA